MADWLSIQPRDVSLLQETRQVQTRQLEQPVAAIIWHTQTYNHYTIQTFPSDFPLSFPSSKTNKKPLFFCIFLSLAILHKDPTILSQQRLVKMLKMLYVAFFVTLNQTTAALCRLILWICVIFCVCNSVCLVPLSHPLYTCWFGSVLRPPLPT